MLSVTKDNLINHNHVVVYSWGVNAVYLLVKKLQLAARASKFGYC